MNSSPVDVKKIRAEGFRITSLRQIMIRLFSMSKKPLSLVDLKCHLRRMKHRCDRTTIYRALAFLKEQGIVKELVLSDGVRYYESARLGHHHHLICQKCAKIQDIDIDESFLKRVRIFSQKKGFSILDHHLEFFGLCADCRNL
ncbi:MAG TPA: transcriptional repressor [Patescibacteria group bacterium]|nr:transcriptional repressor [Patescibacteria group bacterium]